MSDVLIEDHFLSNQECDWFVRFYEDNPTRHHQDIGNGPNYMSVVMDLFSQTNQYEVKYLVSKLTRFCPIPKSFIEYFQVVRREAEFHQGTHVDFDDVAYSSVLYLNDDFEGGETQVGETVIQPKKGTIIGFEGARVPHAVLPILGSQRYTLPAWYKTAEWRPEEAALRNARTPYAPQLRRPMFGKTG
tara:strand:- start:996 stop:1559 length:564 start_codon:yes stop_codon:yes gene_type:complete